MDREQRKKIIQAALAAAVAATPLASLEEAVARESGNQQGEPNAYLDSIKADHHSVIPRFRLFDRGPSWVNGPRPK